MINLPVRIEERPGRAVRNSALAVLTILSGFYQEEQEGQKGSRKDSKDRQGSIPDYPPWDDDGEI